MTTKTNKQPWLCKCDYDPATKVFEYEATVRLQHTLRPAPSDRAEWGTFWVTGGEGYEIRSDTGRMRCTKCDTYIPIPAAAQIVAVLSDYKRGRGGRRAQRSEVRTLLPRCAEGVTSKSRP